MEIIPAIDIRGGRVVRLRQGDFARETVYDEDPVSVARRWVELGAARLHVVDLDGAAVGRRAQGEVIDRIAASVDAPCQVAGGLRDADAVERAFEGGADRVVLGTALLERPKLAWAIVERYGPDRIVAALDVRNGRAVGGGWLAGATSRDFLHAVRSLRATGLRLFAVTAIERDGTLEGPDTALFRAVVEAAPEARVIASGGIASAADIAAAAAAGCEAAILGRALYDGRIALADAMEAARTPV
jgi:phosphoribosylformimino-5-aminoimidazole carboxamide ribotide isomerase